MSELFRFEVTIDPLDTMVEVTVSLWCGTVLLDQHSAYPDTRSAVEDAITNAKDSMASALGNALNDLMRKGGYTV